MHLYRAGCKDGFIDGYLQALADSGELPIFAIKKKVENITKHHKDINIDELKELVIFKREKAIEERVKKHENS